MKYPFISIQCDLHQKNTRAQIRWQCARCVDPIPFVETALSSKPHAIFLVNDTRH